MTPILARFTRHRQCALERPSEFPGLRFTECPGDAFIAALHSPSVILITPSAAAAAASERIRRKSERASSGRRATPHTRAHLHTHILHTRTHSFIHSLTHTHAHTCLTIYPSAFVRVCARVYPRGAGGQGRGGGTWPAGVVRGRRVLSRRPRLNIFHMFS